jgi:hypothetical protein
MSSFALMSYSVVGLLIVLSFSTLGFLINKKN